MAVDYKCHQCGAGLDLGDVECRYCGEIIKRNDNDNYQRYKNRNDMNNRRPLKPYKSSFTKTHKIIGWSIMILIGLCYFGGFILSLSDR